MARKLYSEMSARELVERYVFGFSDEAAELEAELAGRELFDLAHNLYEDAAENIKKQVEGLS